MLFLEPYLKPEIALAWSLYAKNTLDNVDGVSPYQLVFGETPSLPAIYCSGPPGLEEVKVNKGMSEHIQAMHMAREAFIQCENDNAVKTALKKRCFTNAQKIEAGDWIYFKNDRKWEGPIKVTTKDGKLLYAIRAGRLITINSDNATISKCGEVQLKKRNDASSKIPTNRQTNNLFGGETEISQDGENFISEQRGGENFISE